MSVFFASQADRHRDRVTADNTRRNANINVTWPEETDVEAARRQLARAELREAERRRLLPETSARSSDYSEEHRSQTDPLAAVVLVLVLALRLAVAALLVAAAWSVGFDKPFRATVGPAFMVVLGFQVSVIDVTWWLFPNTT